MKHQYESEILYHLMERDGFNIPSSVPPYEAEIKAYLINQVKQAYPKLTDYEAEWLLYNYTKHLPADFPISSVSDVTTATFENVVPFAYQSAILKGSTKYRDIDTGEFLETFEEGRNLELVSVKMPVLTTTGKNLLNHNWVKNTWYPFKLKSGTKLTLSTKDSVLSEGGNIRLKATDETDVWIGINEGAIKKTITLQKDVYKLSNMLNGNIEYQLEIGDNTPYEPYKSNILTVNEEVELRGIGDVKDELDMATGELSERIGEYIIDGHEKWEVYESYNVEGYKSFVTTITGLNNLYTETKTFISGDIKMGSWDSYRAKTAEEMVWNHDPNKIGIKVKNETASNVKELKTFLASNPITVRYELATPIIKTVELSTVNENGEKVYFMPLEGTMHVSCTSETIQPTFDMSVPVEATTQNLASFIDLEVEGE